ncbi:hypothetical protein [Enterococcus sp. 2201sp1_2201st1_B8_2201SCRN_220225]|uniref:hypothetical protein n=1 Tax=unclassified Enterococcus TaxID=2608891 RepID=UPI0034A59E8D
MNLRKYFEKNVRIVYKDGEVITGFVKVYTPAIDTDDELYDEIALTRTKYGGLNEVGEEEIESIEIIE